MTSPKYPDRFFGGMNVFCKNVIRYFQGPLVIYAKSQEAFYDGKERKEISTQNTNNRNCT